MNGTIIYYVTDFGGDAYVFADINGDGTADSAVILIGQDITDVGFGNFI
jgi:hypothetical protein